VWDRDEKRQVEQAAEAKRVHISPCCWWATTGKSAPNGGRQPHRNAGTLVPGGSIAAWAAASPNEVSSHSLGRFIPLVSQREAEVCPLCLLHRFTVHSIPVLTRPLMFCVGLFWYLLHVCARPLTGVVYVRGSSIRPSLISFDSN
jgi:hypothetical protein